MPDRLIMIIVFNLPIMKHKSGLFFGLLAGTALGILFAPKKGKQMRADIKRERTRGGYGVDAVKAGFLDMGKDILDTARTTYESDEVQEKLEDAKETAMEMAEKGKKRIKKSAKQAGRKAKTQAKKTATKAAKTAKKRAGKFTKKKIGK